MSEENNQHDVQEEKVEDKPVKNVVFQNYLDNLKEERSRLTDEFSMCVLLIDQAIERISSTGRIPGREFYADVLKQRPMKLTQKVFVPVRQFPTFNFAGKILGPKGNSLMRLQEKTQCKILIKGRKSMRDKAKEDELRNSDDPRYSHLKRNLYLEISTVATPAECYGRIAYALFEIRKYLIPAKNDEISHKQLREIMEIDREKAKAGYKANSELYESVFDAIIAANGEPKYVNLLKHLSYAECEELEDEGEYEQMAYRLPKRINLIRNKYVKGIINFITI